MDSVSQKYCTNIVETRKMYQIEKIGRFCIENTSEKCKKHIFLQCSKIIVAFS